MCRTQRKIVKQVISCSVIQTIQQTVQSHEPALKCVFEKGRALLDIVPDSTISDNIKKMQADYQDLCSAAKVLTHV